MSWPWALLRFSARALAATRPRNAGIGPHTVPVNVRVTQSLHPRADHRHARPHVTARSPPRSPPFFCAPPSSLFRKRAIPPAPSLFRKRAPPSLWKHADTTEDSKQHALGHVVVDALRRSRARCDALDDDAMGGDAYACVVVLDKWLRAGVGDAKRRRGRGRAAPIARVEARQRRMKRASVPASPPLGAGWVGALAR